MLSTSATKRRPENVVVANATEAGKETAQAARLRYVHDTGAGISRLRAGKTFRYANPDGSPVRQAETLARIKALAIPPAWTEVWICPLANGHLQATGRDAKGRKQYRYHARWRAVRSETKYDRMIAFGQALTQLRERVEQDLQRPGLPREKVLATVIRLLETTHIRIGNEEYARTNGSYGLTTMRNAHVKIKGAKMRFQFRGKSGVRHAIDLQDRRLARIVRRCQELPGQELFQYMDDENRPQSIGSTEVNSYLHEIVGEEFTARDFRTWAGTVLAATALQAYEVCTTQTEAKKNLIRAIEEVATQLGNTPSVCRKAYVHPVVVDSYLAGSLPNVLKQRTKRKSPPTLARLEPSEVAVLMALQRGKTAVINNRTVTQNKA